MGTPSATHKASCDAVAALCTHLAVFTGDAGTTGATETSGGGYARQSLTFPTGGMSGGMWVRQAPATEVPVGPGDYQQAGYFNALTLGTFAGSDDFVGGTVTVVGASASIRITPIVQA